MNIAVNMALSMAGPPNPPSRNSSLQTIENSVNRTDTICSNTFSIYKGISDRPLGWKHRRTVKNPDLGSIARDMNVRRWDGAARRSIEWDCLRRDPELWYPQGNCLIHLYGQGQSRRGPAFRVPMNELLAINCKPLLDRFLANTLEESSYSEADTFADGYSSQSQESPRMYELYIPPPPTAERADAFLYHTATRNFFAWIFRKSLVGNHLGGALVGLLNSMSQFRSAGEDNVQAIIDYMDEEGYADMRSQPDHALAILFFAEHFHFRDLWIDAFVHCAGMNEKLINCPGFEKFMSKTSRALVTRSRFEMDMRLDNYGRRLGSFLSDDLSETHLGLPPAARAHLDKFRSFLQSYYVAKFGYYPPMSCDEKSASFPKNIYGQMCQEFQKLYDYLVDSQFSSSDPLPISHQGGICVQQTLDAFNQRQKYTPLLHPLTLLPEAEEKTSQRPSLNRRFSFVPKADKMKPDPRLLALSSLIKATNRTDQALFECTLVRAYRGFEKDCIFSPSKVDKNDKLSQTDARKVRWILIYATLQTLLSATTAPEQVRDTQNVPYNICVLTAGCPPWKEERPLETLLRTQTDQTQEGFKASLARTDADIEVSPTEIKPDIDYRALTHKAEHKRNPSDSSISSVTSRKSTVRKALSTLGSMPELKHPRPQRASYHEILVHGYGNGTNAVSITAAPTSINGDQDSPRKLSSESRSPSTEDLSSRWSNTSGEANDLDSPASSLGGSRRGSDSGSDVSKKSIKEFLDKPMSALGLVRVPSSVYSASIYDESSILQPDPLQLKKDPEDQFMRATEDVKVEWEKDRNGKANDELLAYLDA